jgi:hypothetical protein
VPFCELQRIKGPEYAVLVFRWDCHSCHRRRNALDAIAIDFIVAPWSPDALLELAVNILDKAIAVVAPQRRARLTSWAGTWSWPGFVPHRLDFFGMQTLEGGEALVRPACAFGPSSVYS